MVPVLWDMMTDNERLGLIFALAFFVILAGVLWWDRRHWRRDK
jgi:hypothetical protein